MDDQFRSSPDLSSAVLESALAEPATAALRTAGAPVLVAVGSPPSIVWASGSARAFFGGEGLEAMSRRIFGAGDRGSDRLAELSQSLRPGAPARLERLRFVLGRRVETLTFLCRRTADTAPLFIAAAVGARATANPPEPLSILAAARLADPAAAPTTKTPVTAFEVKPPITRGEQVETPAPFADAAPTAGAEAAIVEESPTPESVEAPELPLVEAVEPQAPAEPIVEQNPPLAEPVMAAALWLADEPAAAAESAIVEENSIPAIAEASAPSQAEPVELAASADLVVAQNPTPAKPVVVETRPAPPSRAPAADVEAVLETRFQNAPFVRFLWKSDGEDRISEVSGSLCDVVGGDAVKLIGDNLPEFARRSGADPDGRLVAVFARRETWSGLELAWPITDADATVPITLGALPAFDQHKRFDGFRGFGVIHIQRVESYSPPLKEPDHAVAAEPERSPEAELDLDLEPEPTSLTVETDPQIPASDVLTPEMEASAPVETIASPPDVATESASQAIPSALTDTPNHEPAIDSIRPSEEAVLGAPSDPIISEAAPLAAEGDTRPASALSEETAPIAPPAAPEAATPGATPLVSEIEAQAQVDIQAQADIQALPDPQAPIDNVVHLRPYRTPGPISPASPPLVEPDRSASEPSRMVELSPSERNAFREIARALGARPSDTVRDVAKPEVEDAHPVNNDKRPTESSEDAREDSHEAAPALAEQANAHPAIPAVEPPAPVAAAPAHDQIDDVQRHAHAMLDRLPIGVLVSRLEIPIYLNRALLDLIGYADADAFHAAGGLDNLFHGRQPETLTTVAGGGAIPIVAANGDVISVESHLQKIDWNDAPATLMTFRPTHEADLAPRIRSLEAELRASDARSRELHAILDTATDGVVVLDQDGRMLSLNRSAEALFGYDQNEVTGEPFTVLLAKDSHATAMDYLAGLRSNGVASLLNDGREAIGRARQGGAIPIFMTLGRVGAAGGQRFCAVLRDMTQWKNVERELRDARRDAERASALKSDFLAKVSHEIRTPLNAILGFAEVIMDERFGPVGNERYKDYLKDIHASGAHVMSLVNDLLDLSKIEAGKLDLNFGAVDANRIVGECVSLLQPQANRDRVIIRASLAPRLPNIVADERSLRQIVLNILANAVKFNEPGGQVIVSTALTDAGHAVIRVKDTGIGMTESEVQTALEPFRQIQTSRPSGGTGLGLPLTKALVEANRASFTIKSKKSEGTLVEVAFPPTRVLAE